MTRGGLRRNAVVRSSRRLRLLRLRAALLQTRRDLADAHADIEAARTQSSSLEVRLNQREAFAHAILDGVELGIVTANADGVVTFVNRTARELLDPMRREESSVAALLGLDVHPVALLAEHGSRVISYPLSRRDGTELDLELSVSRPLNIDHDQIEYFFIFRDTRDDKLRSLERERLERLAAMGTMVAGFAHEVRNPVAALRSLAESLGEELADAKIAAPHVTRMLQVLQRIERLVRTSLQFGRPSRPKRDFHRPWAIVAAALGEVAPRTIGRGDVRIEVEQNLPDVFVDDGQLGQVIVVLLNNALDAVAEPRRVLVRVLPGRLTSSEARDRSARNAQGPPAPGIRFEVQDDGPGIPVENMGRIFDPFFTTKPSGTGLGLSIAQQIVSENDGAIEVVSQRGATTFAIVVPCSSERRRSASLGIGGDNPRAP